VARVRLSPTRPTAAGSVTSSGTASTVHPSRPAPPSSRTSALRSEMTTLAPASSNASAAQTPMPRPPPVINAVWPFKSYFCRYIESPFFEFRRRRSATLGRRHRREAARASSPPNGWVNPHGSVRSTNCWAGVRNGKCAQHPSCPFRSANLARAMYGIPNTAPGAPVTWTDLGLYS
jgi:hypothetical protein